jgi:hypothetical protein
MDDAWVTALAAAISKPGLKDAAEFLLAEVSRCKTKRRREDVEAQWERFVTGALWLR